MRVITLVTAAALPRARALSASLLRYEPHWTHEVVLIGTANPQGLAGGDASRLRAVTELLDLDVERLIARHDENDLSVLLVPHLLAAYARQGGGPVLHLPADVWVLADLEPIEQALSERSVLLTPRVMSDVPGDRLEPTPLQLERAGRIDEALIGIDGTPGAAGFLAWWSAHVEKMLGGLDGRRGGGRPEDRPWLGRYMELAPARLSTALLDDPGCNLNMWNLHDRPLRAGADGLVVGNGEPVRFLNLPGFEPDRPERLNPIASRVRVSRSPVLRELCVRYARELFDAGWSDPGHRRDIGRRLPAGLMYDESVCALHARALTLGEQLDDVFDEPGASAFLAWLEGPAPEGAAHGINRYLFHRIGRERPDVVRSYPDLDGPDGAEYVAWCWAFGREELAIPERFLPPRGGRGDLVGSREAGAEERRPEFGEPYAASRNGADTARDGGAPVRGGGMAVRVTGYLGHTLGLGAAARGYAQALRAAGVPVSTVTVPLHHLALPVELESGYGRHSFEDLVHEGRHGFELVAVNADELPTFVERLGERYFEGPRIGIWGWETNSIPARWQSAFELIDEIWVYSSFMAQNIGAVAPVPVTALAPPVRAPAESPAPRRLGLPDGFLFLFIFDYLSTIQRKNPVGLIEAFKRAFEPGEGPQLLIKTINAPLRPLADEQVLWAAHGRADIHVVDRSLDAGELAGLMAGCDCYASLHRAEGFGLTMAEAMAMAKPVIATGYSGNVDFMNVDNSYLVDYTIGRVGPECEIYPPDGEWAEPSVEHAAELMRRVLEAPEEAAARGARAREDVARKLSPEATGAAMRRRLEDLARTQHQAGAVSASAGAAPGFTTSSHS
jgi:glycosyltransferase involved in cell wall biosynthesis